METIEIGGPDIIASRIALGTWAMGGWMWGGSDVRSAFQTVQAAIDHGVNLIDTAPAYGFGLAEEIIGRALAPNGRRNRHDAAGLYRRLRSGGGALGGASRRRHEFQTDAAADRPFEDTVYLLHRRLSSDQPIAVPISASCSGRRAPHSAMVGPRSRIHRTARAKTLLPNCARANRSSSATALKYWSNRGCWNFGSTRRRSSPVNRVAEFILPLSSPRHSEP